MNRFCVLALIAVIAQTRHAEAFGIVSKPNAPVISGASTTALYAGSEVFMPALSSTMKEGKVVTWLKNEGDEIEAGEAIMVVESDKADMDVEAFEDGFLAKILVDEGEMAPVGDAVALIAATADEIEEVANGAGSAPAAAAEAAPAAEAEAPSAGAPDCEFSQIDMPALSSTMKEGKVVSWLKAEGDPIESGEAIMVVESDKADMDVEAFEDGFLAAIITEEGDTSAVGAPVALIAADESDIPALQAYAASLSGAAPPAAAAAAPAAAAPAAAAPKPAANAPVARAPGARVVASPLAKKKAEEIGLDLSTVAGTGPDGRITAADVENAAKGAPAGAKPAAAAAAPAKPVWTPAAGVIAATPMARAAAKKAKIDLATIVGTGQLGRVTVEDVKMATGEKKAERKKAPSGEAAVELPDGFVPFTGMQKAVSGNMVATLTVPSFQVSTDIEMTAFEAMYQKVKPDGISVSAMLAKACAMAIEKHPIINSSYSDQDGGGFLYKADINIAMAVAIDGGLITPTLQYANERPVKEIAENWKELVGKAKTGTLSPAEYTTGTFTISNMGMFGVTQFGSLLPVGQGGILAVGATKDAVVPDAQSIMGMKKARLMTVTLTCDHRHIYGSDAALFLRTLKSIMENDVAKIAK